jgi:hypothetical protein
LLEGEAAENNIMADTRDDKFQTLMRDAEQAIASKQYDTAYNLLMRAHGAGHAKKSDHLRAHRALIRLGIERRNPLQVVSQSGLLVLAWIFERD